DGDRLAHRKHWIAYALKPAGALHLDAGAERALAKGGRSLLPSGVRAVAGGFGVGDCVRCLGPDGREFARGLVNYGAAELEKIKGAHTRDIERLLGYKGSDEVIHRDDLALLGGAEPTAPRPEARLARRGSEAASRARPRARHRTYTLIGGAQ